MKVGVYCDGTIDLRIDEMIPNLNRLAPSIHFHKGKAKFSLRDLIVSAPLSYRQINKAIDRETSDDDEVLLFTEKPYDNNFFWESSEKKIIVSLSGWDHLTSLSRNNGAVYVVNQRNGTLFKPNTLA